MTTTWRKDPDAVLDWVFDWSEWLAAGEAITSHQVIVPADLTLDSSGDDGSAVTAWLSGGTIGSVHTVTCRVTTDGGRTDDRSITIHVADR